MTAEKPVKGAFDDHVDEGWWEYGVSGMKWGGTGKMVPPRWSASKLIAEIEAERYEALYVVRRWVTPTTWEKLTPDQQDDHPTVDDWTWEQYLEWRSKQQVKPGSLPDITDLN